MLTGHYAAHGLAWPLPVCVLLNGPRPVGDTRSRAACARCCVVIGGAHSHGLCQQQCLCSHRALLPLIHWLHRHRSPDQHRHAGLQPPQQPSQKWPPQSPFRHARSQVTQASLLMDTGSVTLRMRNCRFLSNSILKDLAALTAAAASTVALTAHAALIRTGGRSSLSYRHLQLHCCRKWCPAPQWHSTSAVWIVSG